MILFLAALFALAAAAGAVAIQYDSGYVLLAYGHTGEMTLWVALALLALFLFVVVAVQPVAPQCTPV